MNIPAIRAALERLNKHAATVCCESCGEDGATNVRLRFAVVRVGLRACDAWEHGYRPDKVVWTMEVIADILREAGVEIHE